jgi:DNA repair photolyase
MKTLEAKLATVEEIQAAVLRLPRAEAARLAVWFAQRDAELWDREMEEDAASGRLDFLAQEGESEYRSGTLRDWPGKTAP